MVNIKIPITTTIDIDLKATATKEGIEINKALDFGLRFMLAEIEDLDNNYPENKLSNTIAKLEEKLADLNDRLTEEK